MSAYPPCRSMLLVPSRGFALFTMLGCLAFSTTSAADSTPADGSVAATVTVARETPYAEGAASPVIRSECHFPTDLPQAIAENASQYGVTVQLADQDIGNVPGRVLSIRTESVIAIGGGGYTGKKSGVIHGELRENGQIVGSFDMQRSTGGGLFGFTACGALERISAALGKDVAKWLSHPQMNTRHGI